MQLSLLLNAALAVTPVLHQGDAAEAIEVVAASTGVPPWELRPVEVGQLFPGGGVLVVGHAQPAPCAAAPSTNAAVRELVSAAEKRLVRQEWAEMRERLAAAAAALPCLGEPAEASLAARLFFLDGFAAAELADVPAAESAFRRARASQPELAWDERLAGAGRAAFDTTATRTSEGRLALGPGLGDVGTLWVDGRLATLEQGVLVLAEGEHLVQVLQPSVSTYAVRVRPNNPVALVRAPQARDEALGAVSDPRGRLVVEAAAEGLLGPDVELWVAGNGSLWHVRPAWEVAQVRPRPAAPIPARYGTSRVLVGLGAGLTLVGGAGAVYGWTEAARLFEDPGDSDDAYAYRSAWHDTSQAVGAVSTVVAGAGLATLVTGLVLGVEPRTASMAVVPTPDGGAVMVAGRF